MELLLIRHAQVEPNVTGVLDTSTPGPGLTELGRHQAAALTTVLIDVDLDAIFASTMVRTQQTAADAARQRGHEIRVRSGIREVEAGELFMRNDQRAFEQYLDTAFRWAAGDLTANYPGSEDGAAMLARFDEVVNEAVSGGGHRVALFSHGCAIRVWAAARACNLPVEEAAARELRNTGIITLRGDQRRWEVIDWADEAVVDQLTSDAGESGPAGESVTDDGQVFRSRSRSA